MNKLLLGLLGSTLLLNERGEVLGRVEERGGRADVFDQDSSRTGWGRRAPNGDLELFDTNGNRLGTWQPSRGRILLEPKR